MGWQMKGDPKPTTPLDGSMQFTAMPDFGLVCLPCLDDFIEIPDPLITSSSDTVLVSCDHCGASNALPPNNGLPEWDGKPATGYILSPIDILFGRDPVTLRYGK